MYLNNLFLLKRNLDLNSVASESSSASFRIFSIKKRRKREKKKKTSRIMLHRSPLLSLLDDRKLRMGWTCTRTWCSMIEEKIQGAWYSRPSTQRNTRFLTADATATYTGKNETSYYPRAQIFRIDCGSKRITGSVISFRDRCKQPAALDELIFSDILEIVIRFKLMFATVWTDSDSVRS